MPMTSREKKLVLWRGLKMRCPKCDRAPLFKAYLKPVDHCSACNENWEKVRADDGPAWATMLIVLHLLAPLFHFIGFKSQLPGWASTLILCLLGTGLCLAILPRMKGLFIGIIWMTGAPTSIDDKGLDDFL